VEGGGEGGGGGAALNFVIIGYKPFHHMPK